MAAMDAMLQAMWHDVASGSRRAISKGRSMSFSPGQRDRYRQVLNAIAPSLPAMFGSFPPITATQLLDVDAEYFVVLQRSGKTMATTSTSPTTATVSGASTRSRRPAMRAAASMLVLAAGAALPACAAPAPVADVRAAIEGRVVDAKSGQPIAGAVVQAVWWTEALPDPAAIVSGIVAGGHGGCGRAWTASRKCSPTPAGASRCPPFARPISGTRARSPPGVP